MSKMSNVFRSKKNKNNNKKKKPLVFDEGLLSDPKIKLEFPSPIPWLRQVPVRSCSLVSEP